MPTTTTRRLLPKPVAGDTPNIPLGIGNLADALDNFGIDIFGLRTSIPAIGAGVGQMSAEDDGTLYYATDKHEILKYVHSAGAWVTLTGQAKKSVVNTEDTYNLTLFGEATPNPDRVSQVTMPTDGLMYIGAIGRYKCTVLGDDLSGLGCQIAIHINSNQLKVPDSGQAAPVAQSSVWNNFAATNTYKPFGSYHGGIASIGGTVAQSDDVTTGQILSIGTLGDGSKYVAPGGFFIMFAAAGVYDISLRYKVSSGTITVKNRKLWVWTKEFV